MNQEVTGWTAVRGIAALWVLMHHFKPHFGSVLDNNPILINGHLSVDLFFILSGAVMYYVYAERIKDGKVSWTSYMWKRIARIYPVHIFSLILATLILGLGPRLGFGAPVDYSMPEAFFLNFFSLHSLGTMDSLSLNYPSWSVSAELSAYVIFIPLALLGLKIPVKLSPIVGILVFVGSYYLYDFAAPQSLIDSGGESLVHLTYQFSFLRIWPSFFLGLCMLRWVLSMEKLSPNTSLILTGLLVAVAIVCAHHKYEVVYVITSASIIALLYLSTYKVHPWLIFMGRISYSFYMVHALIEMVGFKLIERVFGYADDQVPIIWLPFMIGITILAGYLTWRYIEEPGRKYMARMWVPKPA
ncbi:MAG: acyltransferase [Pseudomonadota bacterium]